MEQEDEKKQSITSSSEISSSSETETKPPVDKEELKKGGGRQHSKKPNAPINISSSSSSEEEDDEMGGFKGFSKWGYGYYSKYQRPEKDPKELWANEEKLTLEERRKRYRCWKYFTIDQIPTWPQFAQKYKLPADDNPKYPVDEEINNKIGFFHGDITSLELDAIVNAANESCLGGGGVDGAIHSAAGDMLYEECRTLHGCPTGQTKITRGYNLPAKFVLHTVGPIGEDPEALASSYITCLELIEKYNIKTVAFCGVSTGIFGYPLYKASHIALKMIREWLSKDNNRTKVDRIVICTFLDKERVCYAKLLPIYFPLQSKNEQTGEEADKPQPTQQQQSGTAVPPSGGQTEKKEV